MSTDDPPMIEMGKLKLTLPAFLTIISATILFILVAFMAIIAGKFNILIGSIISYAVAVYTTYIVNCLTVGKCNVIAWILGVLYLVIISLTIIAYLITLYRKGVRITVNKFKPLGM